MTLRFDRRRKAIVCALLLSGALPLFAEGAGERGKEEPDGGTPAAIHLPFRGYGLTKEHKVVRIFGNDQYFTVWPLADVSNLPWWHNDYVDGNIASHPWSPWFLFISVGTSDQGSYLYRLNLQTLAVTQETYFPASGINWTALFGLGARCKSSLPGEVAFFSHRSQPTGNIYHVREITNAGLEIDVSVSTSLSLFGDNSGEWFAGPHWFAGVRVPLLTKVLSDVAGNFVPIPGLSERPSGLLSYGAGAYYLSAEDNKMRLVTTAGTSTVLQYIQWGDPALPAPPPFIDLTSPPNFCRKIET